MINNRYKLEEFLTFDHEEDFYYLQIIRRRKDNPGLSKHQKFIKAYYIESLEYLDSKWDEIKTLCTVFNARAYLWLNRRNSENLTYRANQLLAEYMTSGTYHATRRIWDRVTGRYDSEPDTVWVVDVDDVETDKDKIDVGRICFMINQVHPPSPVNRIRSILPTTNGYHIITTPFHKKQFEELLATTDIELEVDVKKDNPTNLYIP